MNIVGKVAKLFIEQNKPLTLLQMLYLLAPIKERYLQEVLTALYYYKYVSKLILSDVCFYVLTCPYFGTPKMSQHVNEWLDYYKRYVLIVKINKLQEIQRVLSNY